MNFLLAAFEKLFFIFNQVLLNFYWIRLGRLLEIGDSNWKIVLFLLKY